ncbi:MAG: hypothetical protein J6D30_00175 [Clostridia bacterium]|nr:hypothetical protein [Clostridia bacterium]
MILYVNIDDLVGLNSISICYAAESKEDVWVSGQTYAELMCVTDTWDATSAPDFYFSDDDPFV